MEFSIKEAQQTLGIDRNTLYTILNLKNYRGKERTKMVVLDTRDPRNEHLTVARAFALQQTIELAERSFQGDIEKTAYWFNSTEKSLGIPNTTAIELMSEKDLLGLKNIEDIGGIFVCLMESVYA